MKKGSHHSEESKRKLSEAFRGRPPWCTGLTLSDEHKRKLSESHKGKHLSKENIRKLSEINRGKQRTEETKRKISEALKGKKRSPFSEEWKQKISEGGKGKIIAEKQKRMISEAHKGSKNPQWKGGITPIVELIRGIARYNQWRMDCFIRDNFTCQICKDNSGGNLEVHHKKSLQKLLIEVKKYLPLFDLYQGAMLYIPLWDISNGITLCKKCHGGKK